MVKLQDIALGHIAKEDSKFVAEVCGSFRRGLCLRSYITAILLWEKFPKNTLRHRESTDFLIIYRLSNLSCLVAQDTHAFSPLRPLHTEITSEKCNEKSSLVVIDHRTYASRQTYTN